MREMKDSGIGWIEKIPITWDLIRNKYNFVLNKNIVGNKWKETQLLSLTKNGIKKINDGEQTGKVPTSFATYQIVKKDDIVMCLFDLDCSAVFSGISNFNGMISPAYKCFRCNTTLYPKYVDLYFRTVFVDRKYMRYSKNVRYSLASEEFLALPILVPPLNEQNEIANFLDKKCSEIDEISKTIEEQIEVLEEYKKSVISEAVTKGLNPNVETKESGIDYIGKIPSSWHTDKGKFIFTYLQKPTREDDDVITCFRDGEVTLRSKRREDGFTISEKEIDYKGIDIGDLIVHGMDGFAGAIGISDSRGKASPVLNVLETNNNKRYYMYFLRNMAYRGVFIALATGIRVRTCDTNWGKLREIVYALPPKNEQDMIAEYIDKKCVEIDSIIDDKKSQLETIEQYKKTLIYEYVTGKKEVPAND